MKYIITRTSSFYDNQPHPEAVQETMVNRYSVEKKVWTIEIDDILDFIDENGPCVIASSSLFGSKMFTIEIYDEYRE